MNNADNDQGNSPADEQQTIKLFRTGEHQCSYLPDQQSRTLFLDPELTFSTPLYEQLMHLGFRRSGQHLYRPDCENCGACLPSRVRVDAFDWKRRFRRILKRNNDLTLRRLPCRFSEEHYQLYERYLSERHSEGDMYPPTRDSYRDFLVSRPDLGFILEVRQGDRLLAVAFTDLLATGLSATYTFFECEDDKRSLGTFAILSQIQLCRELNLPFLYLGYWVPGSAQMQYKADFRPLDILINRQWRTLNDQLIETLPLTHPS
ncbi:arginyltransferase [Saccharospirillum sp. MSK14-1]|uniref:arginyltransferase n=1 Tax=Saccharospirillum sp. MSK14-1 TaxID=1897632 RepID=UPI000D37B36A|nr:arginyltransferase [Saccharospirillum sp. MSK14-1]PTY36562.1 arginyltransferase [Saccharospirillum sp. MSK14-1]